ncbi:hypothetical protein LTR70_009824 [Exophiala xenobiotica]|nr:hypothetical protein LTR70_009824 [Exophiala xenobiotica]
MADSTIEQLKTERTAATREDVLATGPSGEYMRARVQTLTSLLIRRFGDILDVAITPPAPEEGKDYPPTLVDTMNKKLTVDIATTAMVRAAEELMVLTRTMKELWLFGDLDTLASDQSPEEKEKSRKMRADESAVVAGLQEWLRKNGDRLNKPLSEQEDIAMSTG